MRITVGMGSCGIAAGADRVYEILSENAERYSGEVAIVGCNGLCYDEPIVTVDNLCGDVKTYTNVDEKAALEIVKVINGEDVDIKAAGFVNPSSVEFRIALRNCGVVNPENIDDYIAKGGYTDIVLTPEQIIEEVKTARISGRGGAGFPTWFKWQAARNSDGEKKYIICNADEGDPGAFMDRAILEGDPHSVIEGMIIAAKAIGGDNSEVEGIIYVRAEYPLAVARLKTAIKQARERGYLNESFDIFIKKGAGAFVCGEETALIASLEGERGMPRLKPPFPAEKGYRQMPSNINNVETLANIPWIIKNGGEAFSKISYAECISKSGCAVSGTKVFALTGKVKNGGLVEVLLGCTIRDVIGNAADGLNVKAVQLGGPSGGCIPERLFDTKIDYKTLAETGAIMGSGGMVVLDETTCMVDIARYFLDFTCKESCGKCTHCRVGSKRMLEILERICKGNGKDGDIELLEELGEGIKAGSLCALGQTAPNPVLTTIKYFRDEYEDHIGKSGEKKCTAGYCNALLRYFIDSDKCKKCGICEKECPASAITDLVVDNDKCTKCGVCANLCKFKAVKKG